MSERAKIPYGLIAGSVMSFSAAVGFGIGAAETSTDHPSYQQALASHGLNDDYLKASVDVGQRLTDARHSLEYTPPNTNCNVKVFDIPTGGCDPEKFPDIKSAVHSMDLAGADMEILAVNASENKLREIERSVVDKNASFNAKHFEEPLNNETYSAQRLAIHNLEEELANFKKDVEEKKRQAGEESSMPDKQALFVLGTIPTAGFGFLLGIFAAFKYSDNKKSLQNK